MGVEWSWTSGWKRLVPKSGWVEGMCKSNVNGLKARYVGFFHEKEKLETVASNNSFSSNVALNPPSLSLVK